MNEIKIYTHVRLPFGTTELVNSSCLLAVWVCAHRCMGDWWIACVHSFQVCVRNVFACVRSERIQYGCASVWNANVNDSKIGIDKRQTKKERKYWSAAVCAQSVSQCSLRVAAAAACEAKQQAIHKCRSQWERYCLVDLKFVGCARRIRDAKVAGRCACGRHTQLSPPMLLFAVFFFI